MYDALILPGVKAVNRLRLGSFSDSKGSSGRLGFFVFVGFGDIRIVLSFNPILFSEEDPRPSPFFKKSFFGRSNSCL